jgi:hypothetical protein
VGQLHDIATVAGQIGLQLRAYAAAIGEAAAEQPAVVVAPPEPELLPVKKKRPTAEELVRQFRAELRRQAEAEGR